MLYKGYKPLLGDPAIRSLKLLKRVRAIEGVRSEELFPQLFTGLGKLEEEYTIRLREGAQPFALNTPVSYTHLTLPTIYSV